MKLEPYLHFNGTCEEALQVYARILGGEIVDMNRYSGSPMENHGPEGWGDKIMHATFRAPGVELMASDTPRPQAAGGRVSLSIGLADAEEGRRIFTSLADGGTVTMPYEKRFWGASFGTVTDRFGVDWMINAG